MLVISEPVKPKQVAAGMLAKVLRLCGNSRGGENIAVECDKTDIWQDFATIVRLLGSFAG